MNSNGAIVVILREQQGSTLATCGDHQTEGKSRAEALGKLVLAHAAEFGFSITTEIAERPESPQARAIREFTGLVCPVCSEPKGSTYWFCRTCWEVIRAHAKDLYEKLWRRKTDHLSLTYYQVALAWLKRNTGAQG